MRAFKTILLVTVGSLASNAAARDRNPDIEIQIKTTSPQISASMDQGHFLMKNREFGLAVDVFRKIIRTDPKNAKAYSAIAIAYDGLGRPDLARKNFELALAHAPLEQKHYRNLARHMTASGETVLAHKIMRDFEIARQQVDLDGEQKNTRPAQDISTLLERLENTSVPVATGNLPAPPPEEPEPVQSAVLYRDIEDILESDKEAEPRSADSGKDDWRHVASSGKIDAVETNHILKKTTLSDVEDTIAGVYAGLGITIDTAEPIETVRGDQVQANSTPITSDVVNNMPQRQIDESAALLSADLNAWLADLAKPKAAIVYNDQLFDNRRLPKTRTTQSSSRTTEFRLVRQSLSEVLLTTATPNRPMFKPVRSASKSPDLPSANPKIRDTTSNASHYFAAIRSIFDKRAVRVASASPDVVTSLALKQLELAMADLAKKRLGRLPRIDQGPSQQMQQIALGIYKDAAAVRANELKPVKQDIRIALLFRMNSSCAT